MLNYTSDECIKDTQTQAATAHQCSRDADRVGVGGGNGHPSDLQRTALTNNDMSEDRDRMTGETSDSEAPRPISSRTCSRLVKEYKKRVMVQNDVDAEDLVDDDETLERDEDLYGRRWRSRDIITVGLLSTTNRQTPTFFTRRNKTHSLDTFTKNIESHQPTTNNACSTKKIDTGSKFTMVAAAILETNHHNSAAP